MMTGLLFLIIVGICAYSFVLGLFCGIWLCEKATKADMVAMLTELQLEIGEIEEGYTEFDEENKRSLTMIPLESVDWLIQQKINELKAESEEE